MSQTARGTKHYDSRLNPETTEPQDYQLGPHASLNWPFVPLGVVVPGRWVRRNKHIWAEVQLLFVVTLNEGCCPALTEMTMFYLQAEHTRVEAPTTPHGAYCLPWGIHI